MLLQIVVKSIFKEIDFSKLHKNRHFFKRKIV